MIPITIVLPKDTPAEKVEMFKIRVTSPLIKERDPDAQPQTIDLMNYFLQRQFIDSEKNGVEDLVYKS